MWANRVLVWFGKELREITFLSVVIAVCVVFASGGLRLTGADDGMIARVALLSLAGVVVVVALMLGQRQARDLGGGTLRHLLSLPMRPGEIIAGKALAWAVATAAVVLAGSVSVAVATPEGIALLDSAGVRLLWVARVVLLAAVLWSMELAADSFPRIGLVAVLTMLATYVPLLTLSAPARELFNVLLLVPPEVRGKELAGAALAAGVLVGVSLTVAVVGLRTRVIE